MVKTTITRMRMIMTTDEERNTLWDCQIKTMVLNLQNRLFLRSIWHILEQCANLFCKLQILKRYEILIYRIVSYHRFGQCAQIHTLYLVFPVTLSLSLPLFFSIYLYLSLSLFIFLRHTICISLSYSLYCSPSHAHHLSLYLSISHKIVSLRFLLFMLSYDDSHPFQVEFPLPYGIQVRTHSPCFCISFLSYVIVCFSLILLIK